MINLINIEDNFNKSRNSIIDIFINYYGPEYSDIIKKRLDNIFLDFSSTPEEEYKYLIENGNQINDLSKLLINLRYKNFKRIQNESKQLIMKPLIYSIQCLLMSELEKIDIESEKFLLLFMDKNLNGGCIDAFSSKSIALLNKYDAVDSLKESILNDQNEFRKNMEILGINFENLNTENVDNFIEYRKKLQTIYKKNIVKKSKYGKNMYKEIRKKFGVELTPEELSFIALTENACAGYIYAGSKNNVTYHQIIKIPLLHLINIDVKGLDVNIIHELIHKIETNGDYVGISIHDENRTNNIINEIRTQNLAIKITKQLHKIGIFIYDNPDDYNVEGECTYEALFPLTQNFINEYEEIFSSCAINNTPNELFEYFGEDWKEFSEQIDYIYYEHMKYFLGTNNIPYINSNDKITKLINNMNSFKRRGVKNV